MKNLTLNINQLQSVKLQLHLIFNVIKQDQLKTTDIEYLAYFILFGHEGKFKILEDAVSVSKEVWHNKLNLFRDLGIVIGKGQKTILNPDIKIILDSFNYKLIFNVQ